MKKAKLNVIVTSAALMFAAASAGYAVWQKKSTEEKVLAAEVNTMLKLRRVSEQNTLPHPNKDDFKKMNGKSCTSIAYQIETHTYSDTDFGNFSRECTILILNGVAKNMKDDERRFKMYAQGRKGHN